MNKIQRLSSRLLQVLNIFLVIFPAMITLGWLLIDAPFIKSLIQSGLFLQPVATPEGMVYLHSVNWTFLSKSLGLLGQWVGFLPFFLSFFVLKKLFQNYQKGQIFNFANAISYKQLGWLFFWDALLAKPISQLLMVLALTISNQPGHRYLHVSFGTPNLEALFCGGVVILISWVMAEASQLHDDQKWVI